MAQHNAGVLCPSSSDLFLKLYVDWGYDGFLSDAPKSFELATLGFPTLIARPIETRIACITHSLLAFLPSFPAVPEIIHRCLLIEM